MNQLFEILAKQLARALAQKWVSQQDAEDVQSGVLSSGCSATASTGDTLPTSGLNVTGVIEMPPKRRSSR